MRPGKKNFISLLVLVLLALAGVFVFVTNNEPENTSNQDTTSQQPNESTLSPTEAHLEGANIGEAVDATSQERVEVSITDFMYEPTELTISVGTTVVWTNNGRVAHDVTSDSEGTDLGSELLANGESYEFTFDEPGEYLYHCSPHPIRMRAAITVVE